LATYVFSSSLPHTTLLLPLSKISRLHALADLRSSALVLLTVPQSQSAPALVSGLFRVSLSRFTFTTQLGETDLRAQLPYRVRWQDLKDLFRKAGTVLRADVSLGPDNRSRGHGTVLLATAEDAGRAVDMFNGYSWQSRVLEVRLDRLPNDFDNFSNPTLGYHISVPISSHAPVIAGLRPPHSFSTTLPPSISPLSSSSFAPQIPVRSALDESNPDHSMIYGHDRPATAGGISRNLFVGNVGLLMVVI